MTPSGLVVAIAGLPGTGKTTAAKLVAEQLGLRYVSAGTLFRAMATERGATLAEFSAMAEGDPRVDRALDDRMGAEAQKGGVVLEGRLTAWVCARAGVRAHRVRLDASPSVRAERIARREGIPVVQALRENEAREHSERARYLQTYGVDMEDDRHYDAVVHTDALPPDQVARIIAEGARRGR